MTSASSSPPNDVPFTVRDRRRKGFFTIDNELLDRYGAQLKAHGLAVYIALARFANQEGTCWPSLATIAKRTGMSRMQVIRELANQQDLGLIAIEHQYGEKGEPKANIYTLLNLPEVVTDSDHPSHTQLQGVVTDSDHPSHREKPKQYPENKTHLNHTQRTKHARKDQENTNTSAEQQTNGGGAIGVAASFSGDNKTTNTSTGNLTSVVSPPPPTSADPPSLVVERQSSGASALIATGMTAKVAQRLADRYSLDRIEEKLSYLDFLQAQQPEKVKNPCGWLRKAIEDDFAAPDGYLSLAERAQRAAEQASLAQEELVQAQAVETAYQQAQAQQAAHAQAYQVWLQQTYGTTARETAFWAQALPELQFALPAHPELFQRFIQPAAILQVTDTEVVLGFAHDYLTKPLTHPGIKKRIEQTLSAVAGRTLQVRYEVIPPTP